MLPALGKHPFVDLFCLDAPVSTVSEYDGNG